MSWIAKYMGRWWFVNNGKITSIPDCKCACHENKLNKPYEHSGKCCDYMNGFIENQKQI